MFMSWCRPSVTPVIRSFQLESKATGVGNFEPRFTDILDARVNESQYNLSVEFNQIVDSKRQSVESKVGK